ncbi:Hsp70 family protein [Micromonospora sp. NPDC049679]|uniref:Hsp70 family protein n=1 Tax=Micromonospora sp. NPDC049679 TaxID=3155920 RepID=UPI0033F48CFF
MTEPILVVDVGTSTARAALVVDGQVTLVKEPVSGATAWPASVCVADEGYVVGTAAEIRKRAIPGRYIDGPRRAVDAQAAMRLEHREITGAEALTAYLTALATEARQQHGAELPRLLLTVPADYPPGDPRRDIMISIGEACGFPDVELISDAVAAALDPQTTDHLPAGALVLVCDLGATWTTAMVQVYGSHTTQLAQETCAAGRDLDAQLINDLRTEGRTWLEPLLAAPGDAGLRAYYEAIDFMRRLKHQLGDGDEVSDHFTPVTPPYRLTRVWLEAFAEPALRWLAASCQRVMATVGATPATVGAIVLAGGGARLPMTASTLHRGLGLRDGGGVQGHPLRRSAEPELAAVRGAARFAAGAPTRVIAAEAPRWRIQPVSWEIPGGEGRLLRWTVTEGRPYAAGAVLAQVRTTDERVFDLTAARHGTLLSQTVGPGQPVGAALVAAVTKDAASLLAQPPARRHHLESDGSWLLTADRQHLVECNRAGNAVHIRTITDAALVAEFHPDHGGTDSRGRVFLDSSGHLCLIAWDGEGFFSVWDIETGKLMSRFRDPGNPGKVLVNEAHWRLAAEGRGKGVGRFGRPVTTFWDLRTGAQIAKVTDEQWRLHEPGYSSASLTEGLARSALSPDGQLRAIITDATDGSPSVLVTEAATERELFRAQGGAQQRARVAFSGDGRHLLANWESDERSLLDVWDV